jgi:bHLH factor
MSSLVHSVVSDVIAAHQRLQQEQQQSATRPPALHLDSNNNTGGGFAADDNKRKSAEGESVKSAIKAGSSGEKYSLRPRSFQRRSESEESDHTGGARRGANSGAGSATRPKQKPPPLSKYRRKTANARERDRMREINAAFETLRRAVPHISTSAHQNQHDSSGSEKLTKITTLRLAMKYIAALSQALQQPETLIQMSEVSASILPPPNSISNSSSSSCSCSLQLMSDGESLTFSEHCLTPPDLTPPDFTRQCLTPANLTRLSSPDHSRHRTPPPENKRQNLSSSPEIHKTIITSSQNILSSELGITTHCLSSASTGDLCDNHPSAGHSRHCLLSAAVDQQCHQHPSASDSRLCLSTPVLQPPDLSHHCLTPVDFEEHTTEEHSSLLVFDDDSLDSPDLDHLLIS